MDWRPDHGESGWPTFLYAVPLGGGAVLLEETSLARRPGLPQPVLRRRLHARLARHGIAAPTDAPVERVRFPVDRPRHATPGVLGFGAAAPLVHPATRVQRGRRAAARPGRRRRAGPRRPGRGPAPPVARPRRRRAPAAADRPGGAAAHAPPRPFPPSSRRSSPSPNGTAAPTSRGRDDLAGHLAAMGALFGRADTRLRGAARRTCLPPTRPGPPDAPVRHCAAYR